MTALVTPQNLAAERAVLTDAISSHDDLVEAIEMLTAGDFSGDAHRVIFAALVDLASNGIRPDIVTLANALRSAGSLDAAGGLDYVLGLVEELPSGGQIRHYAEIVKDTSTKRAIQRLGVEMIQRSQTNGPAAADVEALATAAATLADPSSESAIAEIGDVADSEMERIKAIAAGGAPLRGVGFGIDRLDADLGGALPGQFVVIASRPGVGKSAFATGLAVHAACVEERSVLFVSLEMGREEVTRRAMSWLSGVSISRVVRGRMHNARWSDLGGDLPQIERARSELRGARIIIADSGDVTPARLRARCRALKTRRGLDLVVVDYLQLMSSGGGVRNENRTAEVSAITRALKCMARDLEIPFVVLSQLNRESEKRSVAPGQGTRLSPEEQFRRSEPRLAELRESGSIEQDADAVILLHRRTEGEEHEIRTAVAILAKHRDGPTGRYGLRFRPDIVRFDGGV